MADMNKGMLPLMMGIGILSQNQARPYNQGPPTLGAGLAQGAQLYLQQMAAQQKAAQEQEKLAADQAYRTQMLEYQKQRLNQPKALKAQTLYNPQGEAALSAFNPTTGEVSFNHPVHGLTDPREFGYTSPTAPKFDIKERDLGGDMVQDWEWDSIKREWVRPVGASHSRFKPSTGSTGISNMRTVEVPDGRGGKRLDFAYSRGGKLYTVNSATGEEAEYRGGTPATESRLQQGEERREEAQDLARQREDRLAAAEGRLRAETGLEATQKSISANRQPSRQLSAWNSYQKQEARLAKGEARQSVVDQSLMVAYAQSQTPDRDVSPNEQDYIIGVVRNLAEAIGMGVGGLIWGRELPADIRQEMRQKVGDSTEYLRRERFNVDYSLGLNLAMEGKLRNWVPPKAEKVVVDGRIFWVYTDDEEYDVTELYQE